MWDSSHHFVLDDHVHILASGLAQTHHDDIPHTKNTSPTAAICCRPTRTCPHSGRRADCFVLRATLPVWLVPEWSYSLCYSSLHWFTIFESTCHTATPDEGSIPWLRTPNDVANARWKATRVKARSSSSDVPAVNTSSTAARNVSERLGLPISTYTDGFTSASRLT